MLTAEDTELSKVGCHDSNALNAGNGGSAFYQSTKLQLIVDDLDMTYI